MYKFQIRKNQTKTIRIDKSGKYVVELVGEGAEVEGRLMVRHMGRQLEGEAGLV